MAFRFRVGGVNLLPYIAEDGIRWTRFDVEAPDTGRTLDGVMHRGRVAKKVRLDITCRPLQTSEAMTVLRAIEPEIVSVQYVNVAGQVANTPFNGVNMVVTRYADGSTVTTKVIK